MTFFFDSILILCTGAQQCNSRRRNRYQILGPRKPGRRGWKWRGLGHSFLRQTAKPVHQPYKVWTIWLFYRCEFQSQSTPRGDVPHYTFGPDLSLLDTKMNLRPRIDGACLWSVEEHTTKAQVVYL